MSFEVSWRKVRGELPGWCAGDAGMVPLSARETAKGEEQATQLAALRQVSAAIQRILLRAKRKPAPSTQAVRARSLTGAVCWRE